MNNIKFGTFTEEEQEVAIYEDLISQRQLVLYNDDFNTFDWVIESLIKVCKHQMEQAEQCAHIVHFNGKCAVKDGDYDKLEPMCTALLDRGLSASIE